MTALEWVQSQSAPEPSAEVYCPTRDVATARAQKVRSLPSVVALGADIARTLTVVLSELADNCFDHNLGNFRDVTGCWLEVHNESGCVRAIVADRGQGLLATLKKVRTDVSDDEHAIQLAFRGGVSGRAPEKRGNGLRFIWNTFNREMKGTQLRYYSGTARLEVSSPTPNDALGANIQRTSAPVYGVYAEMVFRHKTDV